MSKVKVQTSTQKKMVEVEETVKEFTVTMTEDEANVVRSLLGRCSSGKGAVNTFGLFSELDNALRGVKHFEIMSLAKQSATDYTTSYQRSNTLKVVEP